MLAKYIVEYSAQANKDAAPRLHHTDDPVALEEFLEELLDQRCGILAVKHEGVNLPRKDFDKLVKAAAGALASKRICNSLHIKPEEERFRFGFAA
jgi:hypothetical protein